jgi:hypothetical protein
VATRSVPRNKSNMRVSLQLINTHLESVIGGNETPSPSDSPLLGVKFGGGEKRAMAEPVEERVVSGDRVRV